jgi:hypothetical protein
LNRTAQDPLNIELPYHILIPEEEPASCIATLKKILQENILVAQFANVLAIEERELECPDTPNEPTYLQLIKQAVTKGLNIPPPPPAILQIVQPPVYQPVPQLPLASVPVPAIMDQSAAPMTRQLQGEVLDTFTGDHTKSNIFKQQFNLYRHLNINHKIIQTLYYYAMIFLSFIKEPLVNNWVKKQITALTNKVYYPTNPIAYDQEVHWTELMTIFNTAFTNTTKQQTNDAGLLQLKIKGDNLDTYCLLLSSNILLCKLGMHLTMLP